MHSAGSVRLSDVADIRSSNVDKLSVEGELDVQLCNYMDVYSNERITSSIDFMRATATPVECARYPGRARRRADDEGFRDSG